MKTENKKIGGFGENLAVSFLKGLGYKIIGQNVRTRIGEIDILAREGESVVIVEVKTKTTDCFGEGFEMVNHFKKRKLLQLANQLRMQYPQDVVRVDIISINLTTKPPEIKHFICAVEEND